MNTEQLKFLIAEGEGLTVEFKEKHTSKIDRDIVALANTKGGFEEKPYSCSSGYFRRLDAVTQKMSQKEVRMIFRETVDSAFEDLPRKDFTLEDISFAKIETFLHESQ